jgi:hypothetical protein
MSKKEDSVEIKYKYILNKVFTGSYLNRHLGHEIINFIKCDNNKRYVYINPWGVRGKEAASNTKYAIHIMGGVKYNYKNELNNFYEGVGVSKIKNDAKDIYELVGDNQKNDKSLIFNKQTFYKIFHSSYDDDESRLCSFEAEKLYKVKDGKRILIKTGSKRNDINEMDNVLIIELKCNPQRSRCYSKESDSEWVDKLFDEELKKYDYLELDNNNVDLKSIGNEQCFAVISDRTNLEDSMSNQIAYFLNRDSDLCSKFIKEFLGIKISNDEKFEIFREKEHIDLLFVSNKRVIVIENKIDSNINGKRGKQSQLSKYKTYIDNNYSVPYKHFILLKPIYNPITDKIMKEYGGSSYEIKEYHKLFEVLSNYKEYKPLGKKANSDGQFLFKEFVKSVEYVGMTKAEQRRRTAYIRLNQKLDELKKKGK